MPDVHGNVYYNVTQDLTVNAHVGWEPCKRRIDGSTQRSVYEMKTVVPGDQIQLLLGGKFLVTKNGDVFHIVEKKHKGDVIDAADMVKLVETKKVLRPRNGYRSAP